MLSTRTVFLYLTCSVVLELHKLRKMTTNSVRMWQSPQLMLSHMHILLLMYMPWIIDHNFAIISEICRKLHRPDILFQMRKNILLESSEGNFVFLNSNGSFWDISVISGHIRIWWFDLIFCVWSHFQQFLSYIMATSFSGGRSRGTRRKPPTMGKQLINFITCGCESSAPIFCIYKAGREPTPYWW